MIIIKKGKWERKTKCPKCESKLLYTYKDLMYDNTFEINYIKCPVCNCEFSSSVFDRRVKHNDKSN